MRIAVAACTCLLAACAPMAGHGTFSGYYASSFEASEFIPKGRPGDVWNLDGNVAEICPVSVYNARGDIDRYVSITVEGDLSRVGEYGHMGSYTRELTVTQWISCRPLRFWERPPSRSPDAPASGLIFHSRQDEAIRVSGNTESENVAHREPVPMRVALLVP